MHAHTSRNIFDERITNLLLMLRISVEVLSRVHVNDVKLGTFIGHFSSDGAASTAVKRFKGIFGGP